MLKLLLHNPLIGRTNLVFFLNEIKETNMRLTLLFFLITTITLKMQAQNQYTVPDYKAIESRNEYVHGNIYQKDFLVLKELLIDVHPGFNSFYKKEEFKMQFDSTYKYLENVRSLTDAYFIFQKLLAIFNDGHTSLVPLSAEKILPVGFAEFSNKIFVFKVGNELYKDILGDELVSINGVEIDTIFSRLNKFISADNQIKSKETLVYFLNNKSFLEKAMILHSDSIRLCFTRNKKKIIPFINQSENKWVSYVKFKKNPITYRKKDIFSYSIKDNICYLQWNNFYDSQSEKFLADMSKTRIRKFKDRFKENKDKSQLPSFKSFLDSLFSEINSRNINTLIVDLRNNGGGNSLLGDQLLSYITPNNNALHIEYKSYVKKSNFLFQIYPSRFRQLKTKANCNILDEELYTENSFSQKKIDSYFPKQKSPIYAQKVIFLSGKESFSSSVMLLTTIKDNKMYQIVGDKPSMKPTSFGDILFFKLPQTKLTGFISTSFFERPDISLNEEESLVPDVELGTTFNNFINGVDPCWDWIIENYYMK